MLRAARALGEAAAPRIQWRHAGCGGSDPGMDRDPTWRASSPRVEGRGVGHACREALAITERAPRAPKERVRAACGSPRARRHCPGSSERGSQRQLHLRIVAWKAADILATPPRVVQAPGGVLEAVSPALDQLRHFCASYLLSHGVSPKGIALQLGHRDGGQLVLSTYGHLHSDQALREIRSVIDENGPWACVERFGKGPLTPHRPAGGLAQVERELSQDPRAGARRGRWAIVRSG